MAKISINLLPPEIITKGIKRATFYKIQFAGIIVILSMVFLASLTVALRILQSRNITLVQAQISQTEQKVTGFKDTQVALFLLKDRLTIINQYLGVPSDQSAMYELIDRLTPADVTINSVSISKGGDVALLVLVPDATGLDSFINKLTTKDENENKISQVSIDSLNRGKDGLYRMSLAIKPSKK